MTDYESVVGGSNPPGETTDDEEDEEVTYPLPRPIYDRDLEPPD